MRNTFCRRMAILVPAANNKKRRRADQREAAASSGEGEDILGLQDFPAQEGRFFTLNGLIDSSRMPLGRLG